MDEVCETNLVHLEEVRSVYPDHCPALTPEEGLHEVAQMHWKQDLAGDACLAAGAEASACAPNL